MSKAISVVDRLYKVSFALVFSWFVSFTSGKPSPATVVNVGDGNPLQAKTERDISPMINKSSTASPTKIDLCDKLIQ